MAVRDFMLAARIQENIDTAKGRATAKATSEGKASSAGANAKAKAKTKTPGRASPRTAAKVAESGVKAELEVVQKGAWLPPTSHSNPRACNVSFVRGGFAGGVDTDGVSRPRMRKVTKAQMDRMEAEKEQEERRQSQKHSEL